MVAKFAGISRLFSLTKPSVANAMQVVPFNNYFKTKPIVVFLPPRQLRRCNQKYRRKCWICDEAYEI